MEQNKTQQMSCTEYANKRGVSRNNVAYNAQRQDYKNLPAVELIERIGKVYALKVNVDELNRIISEKK